MQPSKSSGDATVEEKCWTIRCQELNVSIAEANQKDMTFSHRVSLRMRR
jgi:hypothetical protein